MTNKRVTPEQLHIWYLEATSKIQSKNYNPNAQKQYSDLNDEQKFIDKYIANKINSELEALGKDCGDCIIEKEKSLEPKVMSEQEIEKIIWWVKKQQYRGEHEFVYMLKKALSGKIFKMGREELLQKLGYVYGLPKHSNKVLDAELMLDIADAILGIKEG